MPSAIVTGVTGQDGAYLSEHLLNLGYEVIGLARPVSNPSTHNLDRLNISDKVVIKMMDLTDKGSIERLICKYKPSKLFNLAAQSFVSASFDCPAVTADINSMGVLRLLESVRNFSPETKFYQASTSEMFGRVQEVPQNENTPFYPRSPYGVSKLFAHWMTINYRESYDLFAVSGILFNHESPLRGRQFVTRKIVSHLVSIYLGLTEHPLALGNLEAKRDWGHAKDYVRGMYMMLDYKNPTDFVLATGETYSIREFVQKVCEILNFPIVWNGDGVDEIVVHKKTNKTIVCIDQKFYRPCEVDLLRGSPVKAEELLGWKREYNLSSLIEDMVKSEISFLS